MNGHGLDARNGTSVDLIKAGIIDPVKVCYSAVRNAASVAGLILTTQTLIAKKPDDYDPTAGPARGGGAAFLFYETTAGGGKDGGAEDKTKFLASAAQGNILRRAVERA